MAKFLYHHISASQPVEGDKPYGDLLVVKELRKLQNSNRKTLKYALDVLVAVARPYYALAVYMPCLLDMCASSHVMTQIAIPSLLRKGCDGMRKQK